MGQLAAGTVALLWQLKQRIDRAFMDFNDRHRWLMRLRLPGLCGQLPAQP